PNEPAHGPKDTWAGSGSGGLGAALALGAVHCAEQGPEAGRGQILVNTDAVQRAAIVHADLDIGRSSGVGPRADGVLVVIHYLDLHRLRIDQLLQRALAGALSVVIPSLFLDLDIHCTGAVLLLQTVADQGVWLAGLQVFALEQVMDLLGGHLQTQTVSFALNHLAELDLQDRKSVV